MSAKPLGKVAYEAWWRTAKGVPRPPDVSYDEDRDAWDAAALESSLAATGKLAEEILENAGDEWDRDEAVQAIAVSYARHLERERDDLREQLAAALRRLDNLEDWTTMLIQRDEARARLAVLRDRMEGLRAVLLEGDEDDATVRERAIAQAETALSELEGGQ